MFSPAILAGVIFLHSLENPRGGIVASGVFPFSVVFMFSVFFYLFSFSRFLSFTSFSFSRLFFFRFLSFSILFGWLSAFQFIIYAIDYPFICICICLCIHPQLTCLLIYLLTYCRTTYDLFIYWSFTIHVFIYLHLSVYIPHALRYYICFSVLAPFKWNERAY